MSLAQGMAPFGAIFAQMLRDQAEAPEREARAKLYAMRAETEALQNAAAKRDAADIAAQRDAVATAAPVAGSQLSAAASGGGNLFYSDPAGAQQAAEQEQAIADMQGKPAPAGAAPVPATAVGNQTFTDQGQALAQAASQNAPAARMKRLADVKLAQGDVTGSTAIHDTLKKMADEGIGRAADVILAGGDGDAAKQAFNEAGHIKLGPNDKVEVLKRYTVEKPGYAPLETAAVRVTRDGVVQDIPNVLALRHKLDPYTEAKTGYDAKRGEAKDAVEATDKTTHRRIEQQNADTKKQEADQSGAYQRGMLGIHAAQEARLAKAQSASAEAAAKAAGLTLADLDKMDDNIEKLANNRFAVKDAMPDQRAIVEGSRDSFIRNAQLAYRTSYGAGQPITADEAGVAAQELAAGRVQPNFKGSGFDAVLVNGRAVPVRKSAPEPKAAAAGAPGAPAAGAAIAKAAAPQAKPAAAAATATPAATGPTYQKWIAATEQRAELMKQAQAMSPDRREAFLAARLPELDAQIKANEGYARY